MGQNKIRSMILEEKRKKEALSRAQRAQPTSSSEAGWKEMGSDTIFQVLTPKAKKFLPKDCILPVQRQMIY